ncbi:hypothetical protein ACTA71_003619 [Dictyostelium dimigraforme]
MRRPYQWFNYKVFNLYFQIEKKALLNNNSNRNNSIHNRKSNNNNNNNNNGINNRNNNIINNRNNGNFSITHLKSCKIAEDSPSGSFKKRDLFSDPLSIVVCNNYNGSFNSLSILHIGNANNLKAMSQL